MSKIPIRNSWANYLSSCPLLPIASFMAVGAAVGIGTDAAWGAMMSGTAVLIVLGSFFHYRLRRVAEARNGAYLCLVCVCSFLWGAYSVQGKRVELEPGKKTFVLTGVVTRVTWRDSLRTSFEVETDSMAMDGDRCVAGRRGIVEIKRELGHGLAEVRCGMRVRVRGVTLEPYQDVFSSFDYRYYLEQRGIGFLARGYEIETREPKRISVAWVVGWINEKYGEALERMGVNEDNRALLRALLLADRSELPREVSSSFSTCGTSHVLAVSGLHVGVLAWVMTLVFSLFLRGRLVMLLTVSGLWAYAVLVGLGPSVVRASIMFTFIQLAKLRGMPFSSLHTLSAALLIILLFDPMAVGSVGLWLSFAAVGGLLAMMPWVNERVFAWCKPEKQAGRWRRIWLWLCGKTLLALGVSAVAQLATAPIILYYFYYFPTYFGLNNLVIVPAIWLAFNMALFGPLTCALPYVGSAVGAATDWLLTGITRYCAWAAELPLANLSLGPQNACSLLATACLVIATFAWLRMRSLASRRVLCLAVAFFAAVMAVNNVCRRPEVLLFVVSGRASVVVSDGRAADALMSDSSHPGSLRAIRTWAGRHGVRLRNVRAMRDLETIDTPSARLAIVNGKGASVPPCDICVLNADALPSRGAPQAKYLLTPACHLGSLWMSGGREGKMTRLDDLISLR